MLRGILGDNWGEKRKPLPDTEWRSRIIFGVAWLVCVHFFSPTVSKLINNDLTTKHSWSCIYPLNFAEVTIMVSVLQPVKSEWC